MTRVATFCTGCVGALVTLAVLLTPTRALAQENEWPSPVHDDSIFWFLLLDQVEFSSVSGSPVVWDVEGWLGGDYDRIWMKSEGERATRTEDGDIEVQGLYSRLVAPFWDFQAGIRYDRKLGPGPGLSRAHLVLGLEGLAPYWFALEPVLFISQDGDVSARVTASYEMLLTQRLILQPQVEINLAVQTVEKWGVGSGLSDISTELRLRYEFRREFAPYVGVSWFQRVGRTADLAKREGKRTVELAVLGGLRIWF